MKLSSKKKQAPGAQHPSEIPAQFQTPPLFPAPSDFAQLHHLINHLNLPVWLKTRQDIPYLNRAMAQFVGSDLTQQDNEQWLNFIHPEDIGCFMALWRAAQLNGQSFKKSCRIRHSQLGYRMCAVQVDFPPDAQPPFQWLLSWTDIHDCYEQQQQLTRQVTAQNKMLDASADSIKILTPDGKVTYMNRSGCLALGVPVAEQKFGMPWLELLPEEVRACGACALTQAAQGKNARFAGNSAVAGQAPQYWDNILTPVLDEHGATQHILCVSRDISQQKIAESRLQQATEEDELTGLLNRRAFNQIFRASLQDAQAQGQLVGLLLIDLDYFKHVNDTLGHSAGDHLLQTLGQRFQSCFAANITVARLGGDEFAILVPELQDQAQLMEVAQLAWMQMELPISYAGQYINGGMSIGCSMFPRDAQSASNLLKCADIALNDLKSSGRGGIRMFNQAMFEALEITTRQLTLARSILKSDRIAPFYQPKVLLSSAQVIGFEALLRWHDQNGRLQLPSNIYAAFHDYELASGISEVMQAKIFQDIRQWMAAGLEVLPISINAAPVEFLRDDYAEKLLQRIQQYGIPHHTVELEITEQSLSERGANYVRRALNLLKQSGIQISLDDFGTGHSSLTRLKDYPVDCIKIDRNFVERMTLDRSALAIVKAITQLGDSISLDILVEGIETAEQLEVLKACHCLKGQGFYFYRPMSYADATALLLPRKGG